MSKKIQISFDESALRTLELLKAGSGAISTAQVLRDALGFYWWAYEQIQNDYAVGCFKVDEVTKEAVLFPELKKGC